MLTLSEQVGDELERRYRYAEDWASGYMHMLRVNSLAETIDKHLKSKSLALDVGCGGGVYTILLAANKHLAIGIDISRKSVQATQTGLTLRDSGIVRV